MVFNIQKFCIHDGDGIRTCVFLKGCPLRCVWCHNPEGLDKAPTLSFNRQKCVSCGRCVGLCAARRMDSGTVKIRREACTRCGSCVERCLQDANEIIGREMSPEMVMEEVLKDRLFYDASGGGLTVTGGEPSYQGAFTLALLTLAREAGISRAMETCGIGSRDFYADAHALGTTFLYDIKCMDPARHQTLTGADNGHILANLQFLMDAGADIIIRLPMIPGCNDSEADIRQLAAFLKENEGRYRYAEIMPYHPLGVGKTERLDVPTGYTREGATEAEIGRWLALFASYGTQVRVSQ